MRLATMALAKGPRIVVGVFADAVRAGDTPPGTRTTRKPVKFDVAEF